MGVVKAVRGLRLAALAALALIPASHGWAQEAIDNEIDQIATFARECTPPPYLPAASVGFGPVRKSRGNMSDLTFVSGEVPPAELRFPNNAYSQSLARTTGQQLRFYSGAIVGQDSPKFMWHLLSFPRALDKRQALGNLWDGMVLEVPGFVNFQILAPDIFAMHRAAKQFSRAQWGDRAHAVNNLVQNGNDRIEVNNFWKQIFGEEVMNLIFASRTRRATIKSGFETGLYSPGEKVVAYDHVFFFMPVSRASVGGQYFFVSSRDMVAPGLAYGFALAPDGTCVGSATLELKW